jgi:hypothetical protein
MAVKTMERKERSPIGPMVIGACCLLALFGVLASYHLLSSSGDSDERSRETAQVSQDDVPVDLETEGDPLEDIAPGERRDVDPKEPNTPVATEKDAVTPREKPATGGTEEPNPETADDPAESPTIDGPSEPPLTSPALEPTPKFEPVVPKPVAPTDPDGPEEPPPGGNEMDEPATGAAGTAVLEPPSTPPEATPPEDGTETPEGPAEKPAAGADLPTSLGPLLQAVRDDLREENYDAADAKLLKADELATSEDHKGMVSRLRLVTKYARQFHEAMHRQYQNLKANTEIEVGTGDTVNVVYVVEIRDDGVVFRVNGRNIRYDGLDDLPFGLAIAVGAEGVGMDGPRTSLRRGAYVASVSEPDDEEAIAKVRGWLENAAKFVDDAKLLLAALDDSYDF